MAFSNPIKCCFVGAFKDSQLQKIQKRRICTEEYEFMLLEKTDDVGKLLCKFEYVFEANQERTALNFFHLSNQPILINIKNGCIEDCAETLLGFCDPGCLGIDMADVFCGLNFGEKPAFFYGSISQNDLKTYNKKIQGKAGILLKIHIPSKYPEKYSFETIDSIIEELTEGCAAEMNIIWNVDFFNDRSEYVCDLFIGGVNLKNNQIQKRRKA